MQTACHGPYLSFALSSLHTHPESCTWPLRGPATPMASSFPQILQCQVAQYALGTALRILTAPIQHCRGHWNLQGFFAAGVQHRRCFKNLTFFPIRCQRGFPCPIQFYRAPRGLSIHKNPHSTFKAKSSLELGLFSGTGAYTCASQVSEGRCHALHKPISLVASYSPWALPLSPGHQPCENTCLGRKKHLRLRARTQFLTFTYMFKFTCQVPL